MYRYLLPLIFILLSWGGLYLLGNSLWSDSPTESHARISEDKIDFSEDIFPWLMEHKLTKFTRESEFRPRDSITRGEAAKFFWEYITLINAQKWNHNCAFSDIARYDPSLTPSILKSCEYGLMRGSSGKFDPYGKITEVQALTVIVRSLAGMYDESGKPWYREYFSIAEDIWLVEAETLTSVDRTPITREKLATWLYIGAHTDTSTLTDDDLIVYESEAASADDCTSYEVYDAERRVCSYECRDEAECKKIQNEIDAELDSWSEELETVDRDAPTGDAEEKNILASYRVRSGEQISKVSGTDTSEHQSLWQEIRELSPDTLSDRYIETFDVYSDPSSDVLAFVVDDDGNGKWKIAVNLPTHKESDIKWQKATLIHELAHIITLNKDQFMTVSGICPNYEADEWCTKSSSYLAQFQKKYWGNAKKIPYTEESFVSEYASTNPEEDIAESFAFYILGRNFSESPVRESKMNFFNSYPELVEIREDMRNVLAESIIRARKLGK
jgi:hypothetical protein